MRVGVDVGGTFTVVALDEESFKTGFVLKRCTDRFSPRRIRKVDCPAKSLCRNPRAHCDAQPLNSPVFLGRRRVY